MTTEQPNQPYVVLARKYRPESFKDLIGQDAMVTTLKNAFASDRIAQGYMLTGVRGVGKTTTARILARALNYVKPGLPDRPTVEFEDYGEHCKEIIASRHPDVLEMDAASNTGIDNIREIIESARYRPLSARYKVFIIDEVHMLSKGAFNALLKTLEEPPGHVKFIFATTEVRKVPVTVLSRCQRFDLRRVDVPVLAAHFKRITENEGATADDDALRLISRAAEGSVRDGLSILDQAIAMGQGKVSAEAVREMLGLADRGRIFDLVDVLLGGDTPAALKGFESLHRDGADPVQILTDLAETIHAITRIKAAGPEAAADAMPGEDRRRATELADRLSIPLLSRVWQMLLKGIEESARAPNPLAASEMVVIRIAHTADLPTPDEVIRALGGPPTRADMPGRGQSAPPQHGGGSSAHHPGGAATASARAPQPQSQQQPQSQPRAQAQPQKRPQQIAGPHTFEALVDFVGQNRDAMLKLHLEDNVSLVAFEPGVIEIHPLEGAPRNLAGELGEKLGKWTGSRWVVTVSNRPGHLPLGEVRRAKRAAEIAEIRQTPAVAALLKVFPDAEITDVKPLKPDDDGRDG
jgi:DNA polymerase III subunit gamma/tau